MSLNNSNGFRAFLWLLITLRQVSVSFQLVSFCFGLPQQVLEGGEGPALPAARVVPSNGELFWLIDEPAAASLTLQVERPGSAAKL